MGDAYTHSSFTLLQTTELIREVADHVLRQLDSEVPRELREELTAWRREEKRQGAGTKKENDSSESVEDVTSNISFDLLKRAHKQLAKTPFGT